MGFQSFLVNIFDPVFEPLLGLHPFLVILIITFVATLMVTIIYKLVTDQDLMKRLKQDQKDMQKKLKELKNHPEKLSAHQKEMWSKNLEMMKHSFKPTIFTFIPIIILFGWLSAHLAFFPLTPEIPFEVSIYFDEGVTGEVSLIANNLNVLTNSTQTIVNNGAKWKLSGDSGKYILEFNYNDNVYEKPLIITNEQSYEQPVKQINAGGVKSIQVHNRELKPLGNFSIFGWNPGWFGTYFILSIAMSFGLRKLMNVY